MSNGSSGTFWKWLIGLSGAALAIYLIDRAVRENTVYYCPNCHQQILFHQGICPHCNSEIIWVQQTNSQNS